MKHIQSQGVVKLKSKYLRIALYALAIAVITYILIALIPYWGRPYVSDETRNAFSIDNFFGEYEHPERVLLLECPRDAFFHRVHLISGAQSEIILSSFAIHEGISTDIIIGALLAAADRGVQVRVINNAIGGSMPSVYRNVLRAHENIKLYSFNRWEFFRPWYLNSALHDKYMVVDGRFMILGGRNLSDRYFAPEGFNGSLTYDREVLVYNTCQDFMGSIVDVMAYFNVKIYSGRVHQHGQGNAAGQEGHIIAYIDLYLAYKDTLDAGDFDYYSNTIRVNNITLITNNIGTAKNDSIVAYNLMMLTQNSSIIVAQSPYIAFTFRTMGMFSELVEGRDFTLMTNSLASAVNIPASSSYYVSRRRLINAGITIYEFQSTDSSIHGKTYLFDSRLTAIGSFNMNERSIRSDTESMLIIDSEEFHDIVLDAINDQISRSLRVAGNLRYERCDYVEPARVPFGKRWLYVVAGYLLRMFRFMF